jgi:hypothetical protein
VDNKKRRKFSIRSTRRAKISGSESPSHLAGLKVDDFAHSRIRKEIKVVNTSAGADGRDDERVSRLIAPEIHAMNPQDHTRYRNDTSSVDAPCVILKAGLT